MVKVPKEELIVFTRQHAQLRSGFRELLSFCNKKKIEFVIVSNGLDFYIDIVLNDLGLNNIKVVAGISEFNHNGITVRYIGPSGSELMAGFK